MTHAEALYKAEQLQMHLALHCERITIAGSIRRMKAEPSDIELVCIPHSGGGMFGEDHSHDWQRVVCERIRITSGKPSNGKHIKGTLPCGTKVDLYTTTEDNWGYRLVLATGSAEHNIMLMQRLNANGYRMHDGRIHFKGAPRVMNTEETVFYAAGMRYVEPQRRTVE